MTDIEELTRLHDEEGLSTRQIAAKTGLSRAKVYYRLRKAKVPARPRGGRFDDSQDPEIVRMYTEEKWSAHRIALELGTNPARIYGRLELHGVPRRAPYRGADTSKDEEIRRLYVDEQMAARDIGAKLGISHRTVFRHLEAMGVERRQTTVQPKRTKLVAMVRPAREKPKVRGFNMWDPLGLGK